jgi:hypothetical protein
MTEPIYNFKWWARGLTHEGLKASFSGTTQASTASEAANQVNDMLREKYPKTKWMQGRDIEDDFVTYLPTVQRGKQLPPTQPKQP